MMRIEKTFGRVILVELVQMGNKLNALGFETHSPTIFYRIMPYGGFGVRIITPAPADVAIRMDNKVLLERKLDAGEHTLFQTADGAPFVFAKPGSTQMELQKFSAAVIDTPPVQASDTTGDAGESPAPAPVEERLWAPSHGLVCVSVRFTPVKTKNAPELPPDDASDVLFQMNPFKLHCQAMADCLSKVVEPPAAEGMDERSADGKAKPVHAHTHFCALRH